MPLEQTQDHPGYPREPSSNPVQKTGRPDGSAGDQDRPGYPRRTDSNPTDRKRPDAAEQNKRGYSYNESAVGVPLEQANDGVSGDGGTKPLKRI